MSWLISLFLAGVVFTTESNIPVQKSYVYTNSETTKIINLDETERFEQTYPLNPNGRVSVSNVNGSITITTWDRNEVKLEAVKTADSKERLAEVEIRIDTKADFFSVETNYDNWKSQRNWNRGSKLNVEYRLAVPKNAVLDEIETVNGSVNISNSNNLTKASAVNGTVTATNLRGTANLSTVNGTVVADFDQLQTGGKINLNTVNGRVNLTIPSDANATVKADTVNGSITNEFGLPVRKGKYVGKDLYGKIGSGEVQIRLNSVNGGLAIARKNDGKPQNPVTNLLPATNNSDDDWDNDDEEATNVSKMNKDIAKAQKEAQKEAQKAAKNAQEQMNRVQPTTEEALRQSQNAVKAANEYMQSEEYQQQLREAYKQQREAYLRLAEAYFLVGSPRIEKKSDTFQVKGVPKVSIEAEGGSVSVRGWDKSEVYYSITRISRNRNSEPLQINAGQKNSEVNISVINVEDNGGADRVRVEVFVPKKSNLRIVADGEIRLENVSGEINVEGADEVINIRDVDGKMRVANVDGRVRVIGFKGELETETGDGELNLEGDFQTLSAQTGDGTIILTLPEDANANIETNKKNLRAEGFSFTFVSENGEVVNYKIGKGGNKYSLSADDGKIFIRSAKVLNTTY
jgi:hypothetical protein